MISFLQKKFILQTGSTAGGVSVIDVLPIDAASTDKDESMEDVSTGAQTTNNNDSGASSPTSLTSSTSQQLTAQVAVVQTQTDSEQHFITVGEFNNEHIPMY